MEASYPRIYIYKRIVHSRLFIDAHFNEDIDLDNISGEACFSKFHFIRLFKSIYGSTPHQYLTRVRIEQAKLLLQQGIPVSEACFRVGFDSVSSFTGRFRKFYGMSPSEWQQHWKSRQQQISKNPFRFIPHCFAQHFSFQ